MVTRTIQFPKSSISAFSIPVDWRLILQCLWRLVKNKFEKKKLHLKSHKLLAQLIVEG